MISIFNNRMAMAVATPASVMLFVDILVCYRIIKTPVQSVIYRLFRNISIAVVLQQGTAVLSLLYNFGGISRIPELLLYMNHSVLLTAMTFTANCWIPFSLPRDGRALTSGRWRAIVILPTILMGFYTFTSLWTHWAFYFDENGRYHNGTIWRLQFLVPAVCVIAALVIILWRIRTDHGMKKMLLSYLNYIIPAMAGITVSRLFFQGGYNSTGISFGMLLMYLELYVDELKENVRLERDLELTRLKIDSDQLHPNFLYNSLASIHEIVLIDPEKASELIYDFTVYLRASIRSMSRDELIPMTQEAEYIRSYVNIEKMRFGDRLRVHVDLESSDFSIVPMSIQPLVRSAIWNGVFQNGAKGGDIYISSVHRDQMYEIAVRDNGTGKTDSGRKSRGNPVADTDFQNAGKKLEQLQGAVFEINRVEGTGTVVTVRIPKSRAI